MTIYGSFNAHNGRPLVEGAIYFPRLNLGGIVTFIVDTGADASLLSLPDARRIGVASGDLKGNHSLSGIGGAERCFREPLRLAFLVSSPDPANTRVAMYEQEISIPHKGLPFSLLGRDVLDRWKMLYDPSSGVLEFEVRSADQLLASPQSPA